MAPSLLSDPTVSNVILFLFALLPPLSELFFHLLRIALRRYWKLYSDTSQVKQDKSARNFCKCLIYSTVFFALLPRTVWIFQQWTSGPFTAAIPPHQVEYLRIVLAIVPAYYVFELVSPSGLDLFSWLHHGIVVVTAPIFISGALLDSDGDALALLYSTALLVQVIFFNFVMFFGFAVARLLPDDRRRYRMYFWLGVYEVIKFFCQQIVIWLCLAANVGRLTSIIPILVTVGIAIALIVDGLHTAWFSFSAYSRIKHKVEKTLQLEQESRTASV